MRSLQVVQIANAYLSFSNLHSYLQVAHTVNFLEAAPYFELTSQLDLDSACLNLSEHLCSSAVLSSGLIYRSSRQVAGHLFDLVVFTSGYLIA